MNIALLTADAGNPAPNLGDWFITHAIERQLEGHTTFRVPLHTKPLGELRGRLYDADAWVICGSNLVGNAGTVRTAFTPEDFESYQGFIHALGIGVQADLGEGVQVDARGVRILKAWIKKSNVISVRVELSAATLTRILGASAVRLTGCPSVTLQFTPFREAKKSVFCPPSFHYEPAQVSRTQVRKLVRKLWDADSDALFLAQEPSDLWFEGVAPSARTLHAERTPDLHGRVIASANRVLSFRIHPCLVAVAQGTPAFLLALDERTRCLAEGLGIPCLIVDRKVSAKEVLRFVVAHQLDYPWENIRRNLDRFQRAVHEDFAQRGLLACAAVNESASSPLHVAVLASTDYAIPALSVLENLRRVHVGPIHASVLCLDIETEKLFQGALPVNTIRVLTVTDVWGEDGEKILALPLPERAYACKPALLASVLEKTNTAFAFLDADLFHFTSPVSWMGALKKNPVVLFPQSCDHLPNNRLHGLYNAGLIGIAPGAEPFLEWWKRQCLEACVKNIGKGYYFEQGYLDLAPVLFPEIALYREGDQNAAPWNLKNLGVRPDPFEPGKVSVRRNRKLGSFHASEMDTFGIAQTKFNLDQALAWATGSQNPFVYAEALEALRLHHPRVTQVLFARDALRNLTGWEWHPSLGLMAFLTQGLPARTLARAHQVWGWYRAAQRKFKRFARGRELGYSQSYDDDTHDSQRVVKTRRELEAVSPESPSVDDRRPRDKARPSLHAPLS